MRGIDEDTFHWDFPSKIIDYKFRRVTSRIYRATGFSIRYFGPTNCSKLVEIRALQVHHLLDIILDDVERALYELVNDSRMQKNE